MRLAATNVENTGVRAEPVVVDQLLCDDLPAPIVAVAAVAVPAVAVPVIHLVFFRLEHAVDLVVHHTGKVVALGPLVKWGDDVQQLSHIGRMSSAGTCRSRRQ